MKNAATKKTRSRRTTTEMRTEYDFSGGVRGKFAGQYNAGHNVVILDPEVAQAFPDSKSVNDALRGLVAIASRAKPGRRA